MHQFQYIQYFIESQSIHQNNGLTRITDLNDDVLYETFAHLNLEDLDNIINANERLAPIARHFYSKKYDFLLISVQLNTKSVIINFSGHGQPFTIGEASN